MSKIRLTPTCQWLGTTFLLLSFFLSGCSQLYPEIRYDENTRIYNVGKHENSASGPQTTTYTIGRYDGATDYYVNRQKNSEISPGDRQFKKQENAFPADMTPEEQRASLPLVIEVSNVLFDFDRSVIKSDYVPELDRWVEYFKNNPLVTASIFGHADSTGPTTYNQKLSERRAEAVVNYMADRGIKKERLSAKGFGENHPVAPNDTREGRQKNRRVELNF